MRANSTFDSTVLVDLVNKTRPKYLKETYDAVYNNSTMFRELQSQGGVIMDQTGEDLTWPLRINKNDTVDARPMGSAIPLRTQDQHRLASQELAEYTGAVVINKKTVDLNSGPEKVIDYMNDEIENLRLTLIDKINVDVLTGSGTYPAMLGLTQLIPETNTSGSLHGVNRSNETWWRGQASASSCSQTNAFGPICIKEVRDLSMAASRGQGQPAFKMAVTDEVTYSNALYYMPDQGVMRNVMVANQSGDTTFPSGPLKVEEPPIWFYNAKMIWDKAAVADAIRLFDPSLVNLRVAKDGFFFMSPKQDSEDSFSMRILMAFHGNMVNLNPKRAGVLYNFNS